jgi:hypothetical protein
MRKFVQARVRRYPKLKVFREGHLSFSSMIQMVKASVLVLLIAAILLGLIADVSALNPTSQNFTLEPLQSHMVTVQIPSDGGLHGNLSASGPVNFALMDSEKNVLFGSNYTTLILFNYPLINGGAQEGAYEIAISNPSLSENVTAQLNFEIKSWHIVSVVTIEMTVETNWTFIAIMTALATWTVFITAIILAIVKEILGNYRSSQPIPIPISTSYKRPSFPIRESRAIQQLDDWLRRVTPPRSQKKTRD